MKEPRKVTKRVIASRVDTIDMSEGIEAIVVLWVVHDRML